MTDKATNRPWEWCNDNTCLFGNKKENTQDCILHCDPINAPDDVDAKLIVKCVNHHDELVEALIMARDSLKDGGTFPMQGVLYEHIKQALTSLEKRVNMKNDPRENITEQWDREDGDNAWCLPEDMGDSG